MIVVVWWEREAAASCIYGVREEWLPVVCVLRETSGCRWWKWMVLPMRVWKSEGECVLPAVRKRGCVLPMAMREMSECVIDFRFKVCLAIYVYVYNIFLILIERTDRFVSSVRFWFEPNINQSVLQFVTGSVFTSKTEPNPHPYYYQLQLV